MIQRLVALVAFVIFIGALKIWHIPVVSQWPDWVGLLGFTLLVAAVLSSLGFGPWGRTVKQLLAQEHGERCASSEQ